MNVSNPNCLYKTFDTITTAWIMKKTLFWIASNFASPTIIGLVENPLQLRSVLHHCLSISHCKDAKIRVDAVNPPYFRPPNTSVTLLSSSTRDQLLRGRRESIYHLFALKKSFLFFNTLNPFSLFYKKTKNET